MIDYLLSQIRLLMDNARTKYGVDPVVFLVIYLACAPVFYYSIIRTIRALAKKNSAQLLVWSMVFLLSTVAPFVYVLIFGRNIPWWVYALLAVLIGQAVLSLILRLRRKPGDGSAGG
jgi:hypothetical protein